jgi:hypothetical protein
MPADVALRTFQAGVRANQREIGESRVIELGALPAVESMAKLAICRKIGRHVGWGSGFLKIGEVTGNAIGGKPGENPCRRLLMARVTGDCGVRAEQREPIEVILYCVHGNAPAAHRVAILAIGPELAAMQVGMTIRALLANLSENLADVALAASDGGVHGSKRILRLGVVIELRFGTDRLPTHGCMAALAGD